jgi:hypothetical protein
VAIHCLFLHTAGNGARVGLSCRHDESTNFRRPRRRSSGEWKVGCRHAKAQDAARRAALCAELATLLEQHTGTDGGHETAIPQLTLWRFANPTEPAHVLQQPPCTSSCRAESR